MKKLFSMVFVLFVITIFAQEIKVVDNTGNGDFLSIVEAINYLNNLDSIPENGVIFNVISGQTFTDDLPVITKTASENSPIIFQNSGEGDLPIIQCEVNGEAAVTIFESSWITFDGFKIEDPDITNENVYQAGFDIEDSSNITVKNCVIENFDKFGITSHGANENCFYEDNEIYYTDDFYTTQSSIYGIKASYNSLAGFVSIHRNKIYGLKQASSTVYGIEYNQLNGEVINNMISITADNNDKIFGIRVVGRAGYNHKVYNNTIYLAGAATDAGYAIGIYGGGGDIFVKNNICINSRPEENQYAMNVGFPIAGLVIDNNIYYNTETQNVRLIRQNEVYTDLETWVSTEGFDANSTVYNPEFVSYTNDLHLMGNSLGNEILLAEILPEVVVDIDNEIRNESYPYCGADENLEYPLVTILNSSYTIDATGNGDFNNFADAIALLNIGTIPEGGVTFNVMANQVFTDSLPVITAQGTSENPIIFTKFGEGENPKIDYNYADGVVVEFNGAAYITFDGIDITDSVNDDIQYEKAYYVFASQNITIQNCNISNFATNGIHVRDASVNTVIDHNELFYTEDYSSTASTTYTIYIQYNASADNAIITNNKIYGIKGASANVYGIRAWKVNSLIANNFISLTDDNDKTFGIRCDGGLEGLQMNVYYNSVLLAGNATDDSYCFYRTGTDGLMTLKNNIFINKRIGEYEHLIFDYTFASGEWVADYNTYYSENGQIGYWDAILCNELSDWQITTENDINSTSFDVEFVSDEDLHLSGSSILNYDLAGVVVDEIGFDIDGEARPVVNPYKGADENIENPLNPDDQFAIELSTTELNFGNVYLGMESDSLSVSITNIGFDAVYIDSIVVDNPFMIKVLDSEWSENLENLVIETGENIVLFVKFIPEIESEVTGSINVFSNANIDEEMQVNLVGNGIVPSISSSSDEVNFPLISTGNEKFGEVTIYNDNVLPVVLDDISVEMPFTFSIYDGNYVNEVHDVELVDSLVINVKYSAFEEGTFESILTIYSELIHGSEEGLQINLNAESFDFMFPQVLPPFMTGVWQSESEFGDFDNDGDLDILAIGYNGTATAGIYIYRNLGNGEFEPVTQTLEGTGFGFVDWIDIDNDNDLDILLSGQHQQDTFISRVYLNDGGEYTAVETNLPPLKGSDSDWIDFDNDGDLDLLFFGAIDMTGGDIPVTKIYLNNQDGTFDEFETNLPDFTYGEAKFADYDLDGDYDVAISGRYDNWDFRTTLWKNNGNGQFVEIPLEGEGQRYSVVEWADYDNDGDLDLFVTGSVSLETESITHIYRNDGNDIFTDVNTSGMVRGIRQGDMKLADITSDGNLDLMLNGLESTESWIGDTYINNGDGTFSYMDSILVLKYADYSLGDFDNDNDLDYVLTGKYASEIYIAGLFENQLPYENTPPTPPTQLTATVEDDSVYFEWNLGNDNETSAEALTYNLRVGTESGTNDIVPSMSLDNGFRLIPAPGNQKNRFFTHVKNLYNGTYYASIQAIDNSFIGSAFSNEITFEVTNGLVSNGNDNIVSLKTQLLGNYPNPFNPETVINFSLSETQNVNITVYNVRGQKVRTLINDSLEKGNHSIVWKGKDDNGKKVASGVYFYKMQSNDYNSMKKMLMLK